MQALYTYELMEKDMENAGGGFFKKITVGRSFGNPLDEKYYDGNPIYSYDGGLRRVEHWGMNGHNY